MIVIACLLYPKWKKLNINEPARYAIAITRMKYSTCA
jgi:hypothetical protein